MRRRISVLLCCILFITPIAFTQNKDSVTLKLEMERLNRIVDSFNRRQLQDTLSKEQKDQLLDEARQKKADSNLERQKQLTKAEIQRRETEKQPTRKAFLIVIALFFFSIAGIRLFQKWQKKRRRIMLRKKIRNR